MKMIKADIDTLPEPDASKFVMAISQYELDLIGVALDEFRCRSVYDANLRVGCGILVDSLWGQLRILNQQNSEESEQDRRIEGQEGDGDKPTPDWTKQ